MAAINTAVEASTLNERTFKLRPQDTFIRENIHPEDVLVVSVGGNDVALCPCPCTIASILCLLVLPTSCVKGGFSFASVPVRYTLVKQILHFMLKLYTSGLTVSSSFV